ncbi:hypothetical protein D3C80_1215600 [compost metagenome]
MHVGAGYRIDRTVDETQPHTLFLQSGDPAFAMERTLGHIASQLVQDPRAAVRRNQAPVVIQRAFAGMRARAIDLGDMAHQVVAPERTRYQPAQTTEQ